MTRCSASSSEKPLIQIQKVVTARRLTQAQLAKLLIDMLGRLGVQVRLVVEPTRRRQIA